MTDPALSPPNERRRWAVIAAWIVATVVIVLALRLVDWPRTWESMRTAKPAWLLVGIVCNGAILVIWAAVWQTVLPPGHRVPLRRLAEITSLTSMALNTLPFLVGEASGMLLLAKRARLGHAAALSVLAVDQLLLGIAKICLLLLVGVFVPLPASMRRGLIGLAVGVSVMLALLIFMAHRGLGVTTDEARSGVMPAVRRLIADWAHGLESLRSWRKFFSAFLLEIAKKGAEMAAIVAVQRAFGLELPFSHSLLILGALNLVTVIPVSPANIGVYEAAVYFAYEYLGVASEKAFAVAVVQHVCYLIPLAGTGYVILSWRQLRRATISV